MSPPGTIPATADEKPSDDERLLASNHSEDVNELDAAANQMDGLDTKKVKVSVNRTSGRHQEEATAVATASAPADQPTLSKQPDIGSSKEKANQRQQQQRQQLSSTDKKKKKGASSKSKRKKLWSELEDASSHEKYYCNRLTRETTWSCPSQYELSLYCEAGQVVDVDGVLIGKIGSTCVSEGASISSSEVVVISATASSSLGPQPSQVTSDSSNNNNDINSDSDRHVFNSDVAVVFAAAVTTATDSIPASLSSVTAEVVGRLEDGVKECLSSVVQPLDRGLLDAQEAMVLANKICGDEHELEVIGTPDKSGTSDESVAASVPDVGDKVASRDDAHLPVDDVKHATL